MVKQLFFLVLGKCCQSVVVFLAFGSGTLVPRLFSRFTWSYHERWRRKQAVANLLLGAVGRRICRSNCWSCVSIPKLHRVWIGNVLHCAHVIHGCPDNLPFSSGCCWQRHSYPVTDVRILCFPMLVIHGHLVLSLYTYVHIYTLKITKHTNINVNSSKYHFYNT